MLMVKVDIFPVHLRYMAEKGRNVQDVAALSTELPLLIAHLIFARVANGK